MSHTDQLNEAFTELEKARRNDSGLPMHARLISMHARTVAEVAERIVMDRLETPWQPLPEISNTKTQLTPL